MKTLLAVSGLAREAGIVSGTSAETVVGGGNAAELSRKIEAALGAPQGIRGVISIGLAGALDPSLKVGDCVVAQWIFVGGEKLACDAAWTAEIRRRLHNEVRADSIAGVDRVAVTRPEKSVLLDRTRTAAVDMESHVAARLAVARGIPFAALRIVSDTASQSLPDCARVAMRADGEIDVAAVLRSLVLHPLQLGNLIRAGRDAYLALSALKIRVGQLGPDLACPYPG